MGDDDVDQAGGRALGLGLEPGDLGGIGAGAPGAHAAAGDETEGQGDRGRLAPAGREGKTGHAATPPTDGF
ncbi:hypothetical protein D3C87_1612860 [compost metagenome]